MKINKRHLAKTFSWRFIASMDTLVLAWIITGKISYGLTISIFEVFSKMILYYFHEQFWFKSKLKNSNRRHVYKTISWRVIGTTDTFIISWIITGNPYFGLKISFAETLTKMLLYYLHEKLWYRINYGLNKRTSKKISN